MNTSDDMNIISPYTEADVQEILANEINEQTLKDFKTELIKNYMAKYDNYSKELKDYIDYACPYKIGDNIRIDSLHKGHLSTDEIVHHGEIIDIEVVTKRQVLFRNGLSDILRLLVDQNTPILDEPVPEFIITYRYTSEIRSHKYKFWEKPIYKITESTVAVDAYGNCVQYNANTRKIIEKE